MTFDELWRVNLDKKRARRDSVEKAEAVGLLAVPGENANELLLTAEPGPVPPYASNTIRTLRMLYLLADRGVRGEEGAPAQQLAHRDKVIDKVAKSLAAVSWFAG